MARRLGLLLIIGLCGCAPRTAPPPLPTRAPLPGAQWEKWTYPQPETSLEHPANWPPEVSTPEGWVFSVRFRPAREVFFALSCRPNTPPPPVAEKPIEVWRREQHATGYLYLDPAAPEYEERSPATKFVSGNPGLISTLSCESQTKPVSILRGFRVTVPLPQHCYLIEAAAPEEQYDALQPVFERMLRSIILTG